MTSRFLADHTVHASLIERAELVASRKRIVFAGESATRLRNIAIAVADKVVGATEGEYEIASSDFQSPGLRDNRVGTPRSYLSPERPEFSQRYRSAISLMQEIATRCRQELFEDLSNAPRIIISGLDYYAVSEDILLDVIRQLCRLLGNPWPFCRE